MATRADVARADVALADVTLAELARPAEDREHGAKCMTLDALRGANRAMEARGQRGGCFFPF